MIVACMIVFEGAATLGKCLHSITPFVDRLILVEGAYAGRSDHIESQDETLLLARNFPKPRVIQKPYGVYYQSEIHARSQYLLEGYLNSGDWCFVIDADEYIESGIEETLEFLQNSKAPYHSVHRVHYDKSLPGYARTLGERVQLFRYEPGMRYVRNHYTIQYSDGQVIPLRASSVPLVIVHDKRLVPASYLAETDRYNLEIRSKMELR